MIIEVMVVLLIGEYTEFPDWLPAVPGSGIVLLNSVDGTEMSANGILSVHNPSFLCADGHGGFYALDEGAHGLLSHFVPDGQNFCLAAQAAFEAQGSCHLCVSPEHKIYVSNYDSGTLTAVSDRDGRLEVIQTLSFHGSGPIKFRQSASHIHSCRLSPDGRELFAADLGGDRLYRFDIQKDGRLNEHVEQPYIQLPQGCGPRHMDFHPKSRFMYVSAELSNQIFTLGFDEDGVASVISCANTTECKGPTILTAHLQVSEQHNMLYTCVRGTDEIVWYSLGDDGSELVFCGRCPSGGRFPRYFLLDEFSSKLFVANQLGGGVSIFDVGKDGAVRSPAKDRVEAPGAAAILLM